MKNNIKKLILILSISFLLSFIIEIFVFNFNSLVHKNYIMNANIKKTVGFIKKEQCYISNKDNSKIYLESNEDYISKISFNYSSDNQFSWVLSSEKKVRNYQSSEIFNNATKRVNTYDKKLKIEFFGKNIKICNIKIKNKFYLNKYRIILMQLFFILILSLLFFRNYYKSKIHKLFLLCAIVTGLSIIFSTPISLNTSADDEVHFKKAYSLFDKMDKEWSISDSYFDFLILKNYWNFKSYEEVNDYNNFLNKNNYNKQFVRYNPDNRLTYNKIVYIPFSVGIKISKIFHLNFTNMIYLSKILNLLFYTFIVYYAIKRAPKYKKLMFLIAMLPNNLYLASQFSYDSTITASLLLAFSSFLQLLDNKKIDKKNIIIFILSVVWACLIKAIYAPILLLILLIKKDKYDNKKQCILFRTSIIMLLFVIISSFILPTLTTEVSGDSRISNTSVSGQLKYIFSKPMVYSCLLFKTTIKQFFYMFFGYNTLSQYGYITSYNLVWFKATHFITVFLLLFTTFNERNNDILDFKQKLFIIILLLSIWCLIWTALYLSWTPVGSSYIAGVNGRYFLPLIIYLLYILNPIKKIDFIKKYDYIYLFIVVINFINIFYLTLSYYS